MLSPKRPILPNGSAKKLTITPRGASPRPDLAPSAFDGEKDEEGKVADGDSLVEQKITLEKKSSGYLLPSNDDLGETQKEGQCNDDLGSSGLERLWTPKKTQG